MRKYIAIILSLILLQGCVTENAGTGIAKNGEKDTLDGDSRQPKQKKQDNTQGKQGGNQAGRDKNEPAIGNSPEADAEFNRGELAKFEDTLASLSSKLAIVAPPYLSRPTGSSISINIMFNKDADMYYEYGTTPGRYSVKTGTIRCTAMEPANTELTGLRPNTGYVYRMSYRDATAAGAAYTSLPEATFETARSAGTDFTFAVQADSHLDINSSYYVYKTTLGNIVAAKPDFLVDLGDTFMCEKYAQTARQVELRYMRDRYEFFGLVSATVPVFFTIGNHDGEVGWATNGRDADLRIWCMKERKLLYPNPEPDDFYTGATGFVLRSRVTPSSLCSIPSGIRKRRRKRTQNCGRTLSATRSTNGSKRFSRRAKPDINSCSYTTS